MQKAGQNQTDQAISHLKQALENEPENGKVLYLLGALHAEIGLYDRAVEEMTQAVECDPELSAASFQLGLLHLTAGRPDEARTAWENLNSLGDSHTLFLFKRGLLSLADGNQQACVDDLRRGIELNQDNPDLNIDMQRIADRTEALLDSESTGDDATDSKPFANLAAYQRDAFDKSE